MTRIFVTFTSVGFHNWPAAPVDTHAYLAARHRHTFHFRVELDVAHNDREVEFHDLLLGCRAIVGARAEWGSSSCEDIARFMLGAVDARWPHRNPAITVSEDAECGATVN